MHPELSNLDWFEYLKTYGSKPGPQSIQQLLKQLEDPQNTFRVIHITGTNGKGSTTAITRAYITPVGKAILYAKQNAKPDDAILITGSVFLVGEARDTGTASNPITPGIFCGQR